TFPDHTGTTPARHFTTCTAGATRMVEPNPHGCYPPAVPSRKSPGRRLHTGFVLGDDQPAALDDPAAELGVRGRVVSVDPAAEHGDRETTRLERAAVRLGIDAAGEAAGHHDTGSAEHPRQG